MTIPLRVRDQAHQFSADGIPIKEISLKLCISRPSVVSILKDTGNDVAKLKVAKAAKLKDSTAELKAVKAAKAVKLKDEIAKLKSTKAAELQDKIAEVVRLYEKGASINEITRLTGRSWGTVAKLLKRGKKSSGCAACDPLRVQSVSIRRNHARQAEIARLLHSGQSCKEVAMTFGISKQRVSVLASEYVKENKAGYFTDEEVFRILGFCSPESLRASLKAAGSVRVAGQYRRKDIEILLLICRVCEKPIIVSDSRHRTHDGECRKRYASTPEHYYWKAYPWASRYRFAAAHTDAVEYVSMRSAAKLVNPRLLRAVAHCATLPVTGEFSQRRYSLEHVRLLASFSNEALP